MNEMSSVGASNGSQSPAQYSSVRRPPRSKNGCLTCRRRKVRCSEQRPRCSHCERLNLECKWRPVHRPGSMQQEVVVSTPETIVSNGAPALDPFGNFSTDAVDQVFDYASFMWDTSDLWQSHNMGSGAYAGNNMNATYQQMDTSMLEGMQPLPLLPEPSPASNSNQDSGVLEPPVSVRTVEPSILMPEQTSTSHQTAEDRLLLDYFTRTHVPPILSQVETQQKWSTMRQILMGLCNTSAMVRYAVMAFSELLLRRQERSWLQSTQNHYAKAMSELSKFEDISTATSPGHGRESLLATLFFLSYVDILEGRVEAAHKCLKEAHTIFKQRDKAGFRALEIRLLLWIRLVDARAVSAGGDGLFLSDQEEDLLVKPSPSSFQGDADRDDDTQDGDIEDVLFQLLYHPGIIFFQKVQSFMGRISKIDPWHRPRGTVEDETEVMNIAARITKDLRELYENRPPLMDYAISGKLTTPHVSENLATTITKSFRSYLANFHASRIHLHRVAYKSLPLTSEASEALRSIRDLAKLMEEGLSEHEALPVNMLWPLLMLGSEEHSQSERAWIKEQIMRMEKVATNARITAQVLEEVQTRQDASKTRVDIRSVMHSIFDSCFAIV
ncbi:hypothetical protein DPSP01_000306 [Paraphaeosphaeria sporulosa]|uniref:Zn(2)-C6 fungal-type domain-containing protein n=1 Tax=Paraphaeosphaeria sporulosa TaxID=1460663 RepID=A0A177D024_9PLEO|nr:uncharacterized protein CC84DRAFT_158400 [Paraphaeosphaeria sporulosa]OAG12761.1 hypothetical protein CC84DRAFT_158400 [Paraphaeosphaeria sporulosa]